MKRTIILFVLLFCHVSAFAATHVVSRSVRYGAKQSYRAGKVAKKAAFSVFKAIV